MAAVLSHLYIVFQDPSVSVKSVESPLPTVSHESVESNVSVESEVTSSAQGSDTKVGARLIMSAMHSSLAHQLPSTHVMTSCCQPKNTAWEQ